MLSDDNQPQLLHLHYIHCSQILFSDQFNLRVIRKKPVWDKKNLSVNKLTTLVFRAFNEQTGDILVFELQDNFFSFVLMVSINIRSNSDCSVCPIKALSILQRCIEKKKMARGVCCLELDLMDTV